MTAVNISKEKFFSDHLVPAGQILEILINAWTRSPYPADALRPAERTALAHHFFDLLNLTAAYAIQPGVQDLSGVRTAITDLTSALLKVFEAVGQNKSAIIAEAFGTPFRGVGVATNARQKFTSAARNLLTNNEVITQAIYKAIQYQPSMRQAWLNQMLAEETPITKGGRINKWRTFVRNLSWKQAAEMLGVAAPLAKVGILEKNTFSNDAGRSQVQALWHACFYPENADLSRNQGLTAMPIGLKVVTTPDRLLQVSAEFQPSALMEASHLAHVKAERKSPAPQELMDALEPKVYARVTDVSGLPQVIAEAEAWQQSHTASREQLEAMYYAWIENLRLEEIQKKLDKNFSKDEHELLLKLLSAKTAPKA